MFKNLVLLQKTLFRVGREREAKPPTISLRLPRQHGPKFDTTLSNLRVRIGVGVVMGKVAYILPFEFINGSMSM